MSEALTLNGALAKSITSVTKGWTEAKRHADRQQRISRRELAWLRRTDRELSIKEAAYRVMEQAYRKASANGRLPANARQIMYAARPLVLALTEGRGWKNSAYFTQVLLPDYMEHNTAASGWNVVFDARGRLVEPHTRDRTDLGTLEVRHYVREWTRELPDLDVDLRTTCKTRGPYNRYRFALFIEKEGFYPLLEEADIADRFDLALMSTKGMSVTASRELVDRLSAAGVTILVLHDFDKSGFSILNSLRSSGRRYRFYGRPNVVDLGLRLTDVTALGLESEPVEYDSRVDPRINLRQCGATTDECDVLVHAGGRGGWMGERVELNAMASDQFVEWLEEKLVGAGVAKVIPETDALAHAYRRGYRLAAIQALIDELEAEKEAREITVPEGLDERVRAAIEGTGDSWDEAVWRIAREEHDDEEGEP